MEGYNQKVEKRTLTTQTRTMSYKLKYSSLVLMLLVSLSVAAQNPNWTVNYADFQNTMTAIVSISDECVPSADPGDVVAAFDITGQIRGVEPTSVNNKAFLTIGSNGAGEEIYFKVYDASTNAVYNIYNTSVTFIGDSNVGTVPDPFVLNFDSNPTGASAGPDQEVFSQTTTTLAATGTGMWSIVEGAGGSFVDATSPTTVFNGVIDTKYILAWTLDNAAGCIGETDEVVIYFVLDEPEDGARTCSDGLDNDGDGLTDCNDPDCGSPEVSNVAKVDPTPIDCDSTQPDGVITITATNGDIYSLDGGVTTQMTNVFSNLISDNYSILIENGTTGCKTTESVSLQNTIDPISNVTGFAVEGPTVLCKGLQDVHYGIDIAAVGTMSWSYTGTDATVVLDGEMGVLDLGGGATEGGVVATLSSVCNSISDTLAITFASEFLCSFSNCPPTISITTSLLESANAPQVYRAGMELESNALISANNYEFTAGESVSLTPGFTINQGLSFMTSIQGCTK